MYINFKYVKFKNLLSYGNQLTEIHFKNGLHLVAGKNGHGKSCIIEALFFCLYGQPYRKINIDQLINRKNKSKLYTECAFSIDEKEYVITRTLLPNKISITENGKEFDLLSSKKLVQEEINRILGIEPNLFRQVICLAVNYNKPFLSLPSMEKRNIAESIFNIKVFGDMLKILKKNSSGLKVQSEINKKSLGLMEANLVSFRKQMKTLALASKDFEKDKQKDLQEVANKKAHFQTEIEVCENLEKILLEKSSVSIDQQIENSLLECLSNTEKRISINNFQVKEAYSNISLLNKNDICPCCKSLLTPEHRDKEIKTLEEKISWISNENESLDKVSDSARVALENEKQKIDDIKKAENELEKILNKKSILLKELDHLLEKQKTIESRVINLNIESMNSDFETRKNEYSELYTENRDLNNKIKNNNLISEILSDTGIKTFFLRKMIPLFNSKVNEYLNRFELAIQVIFNEAMDEIIKVPGQDSEISYFSFSEGEKKRIDIAILFSFIEMTKIICNWNCNVLMMDEIMDSATDTDGLDKMMYTIKNFVGSNKNLSIYMISHRVDDNYKQLFDSILTAEKSNGFSRLVVEAS